MGERRVEFSPTCMLFEIKVKSFGKINKSTWKIIEVFLKVIYLLQNIYCIRYDYNLQCKVGVIDNTIIIIEQFLISSHSPPPSPRRNTPPPTPHITQRLQFQNQCCYRMHYRKIKAIPNWNIYIYIYILSNDHIQFIYT